MLAHTGTSVYASSLTVMSICDKVSKQHSNQNTFTKWHKVPTGHYVIKKKKCFLLEIEHF